MTMPRGNTQAARALLVALLACAALGSRAQPPERTADAPLVAPPPATLKPFTARYKVEAFGFTAGTADIILEGGTGGRYHYTTALHPHGLFRVLIPSGATLTTSAETDGASVRPMRYREDDGTEATGEDVTLDFDWNHEVVQGVAHDKAVRLSLPANTQDPMSLQLAVLTDFANQREPVRYSMVDKTEVKEYDYKSEGRARLDTALGPLDTVIYSSSRPGSSKVTRVWYAPALDFTPVRSDQIDDGKVRIRMTLLSLKR
jgi:Protein of unknown function (DUF3108)